MGKTDYPQASKVAKAQTTGVNPIINLPGVPSVRIWQELAEETRVYLELIERLETLPLDAAEREELENQLVDSLTHIAVHSGALHDQVSDAILDAADDDEVEEALTDLKGLVNTD